MQIGSWKVALAVAAVAIALPATAFAHLERPSYWPDPTPDTSIDPPAGGAVPKARSLASAVRGAGPGEVRVVCQGKAGKRSLRLAMRSIRRARNKGFRIRPSQPKITYTKKKARRMQRHNRRLARQCNFRQIQAAINASGNNDRIVIMPGVYRENRSRRQPENDPRCNPSMLQKDASGDDTPSYAYQVNCPHDQNLVYIQGRALVGEPLPEPKEDRAGIPEQELGPCVRCNLQIEGSGPRPVDVIIDAARRYEGKGPEARPVNFGEQEAHAKHVVLRIDRGDGFVGRNFTMRGGLEHGFYAEETDGVLLDRTKFLWNADYGHLSFTSDHHVVQNCDGMGAGDAALYPGATPETGSQATAFWPDAPRYNTVVRRCDMRNSQLGYSGSMGNAVRITQSHIYGNATGIASDTLSSAGHPGFPADSVKVDNNYIYANNFDVYDKDSPVPPLVAVPIGTGIIYAGMNDARVHDNWIFDNWRDGVMLLAVPDALTSFGGPEGEMYPGVSCATSDSGISTSCGNHFFDNKMGQRPPGFRYPLRPLNGAPFAIAHKSMRTETAHNGNDFWWDEFPSNRWNCWYRNTGFDGTPASISGSGEAGRSPAIPPNPLPDCAGGENQDMSVGQGDAAKEAYLIDCASGPDEDTGPMDCDWWTVPPSPQTAAAQRQSRERTKAAAEFDKTAEAARLRERMAELTGGG